MHRRRKRWQNFYPRPPCGGRQIEPFLEVYTWDFYPRPPCGGRHENQQAGGPAAAYFYPRPPCGGRRGTVRSRTVRALYFYPRPPCGGRRGAGVPLRKCFFISIHALRAEGDFTPPQISPQRPYFYPRPPCGGRPLQPPVKGLAPDLISIHALRAEGDRYRIAVDVQAFEFLSTPSVRRATCRGRPCHRGRHISIHALRAEGDSSSSVLPSINVYFYPRPPCGGRLVPGPVRRM